MGDRVLLAHHRELKRWLQPGGHSDGDPDTLPVALREAREESGLDVRALDNAVFDIDVHGIPARGGEPAHLYFDVRFVERHLIWRWPHRKGGTSSTSDQWPTRDRSCPRTKMVPPFRVGAKNECLRALPVL